MRIARLGPAGSLQRELLEGALRGAQPNGPTPLQDAYRFANRVAAVALGGIAARLVLVTDGSASLGLECKGTGNELSPIDPTPMLDDVREATGFGMQTFIVSTPGSAQAQQWLSKAALIAGTGRPRCTEAEGNCDYDLLTTPNLAEVLTNWGTPGCDDIAAPKPIGPSSDLDAARVSVMVTQEGQTTLLRRACPGDTCLQGFQVLADLSVRLCPDTCSALRSGRDTVLEVAYGCRE